MLGHGTVDVLHYAGSRNAHQAAWLHEPCEVVKIQVVGPSAVGKRIDADDGAGGVRFRLEFHL